MITAERNAPEPLPGSSTSGLHAVGDTGGTVNQRQLDRFDVVLPVLLVHGESEVQVVSRNVSLGGMLLEGTTDLPFGTRITLRVHLPAMKEPSDLGATIRWVRDGAIGVHFGVLRAKETWALNQLTRRP